MECVELAPAFAPVCVPTVQHIHAYCRPSCKGHWPSFQTEVADDAEPKQNVLLLGPAADVVDHSRHALCASPVGDDPDVSNASSQIPGDNIAGIKVTVLLA